VVLFVVPYAAIYRRRHTNGYNTALQNEFACISNQELIPK